jgi:hypothetical protein
MIIDSADSMLLHCLQREPQEEKKAFLNKLEGQDWRNILAASIRFGLTPIIFYSLKRGFTDLWIPDDVWQRMKEIYLKSVARNIRLYHQLAGIISLLNGNGISVILLKGAHLARYVYGNLGLRPMADIDLLAKKNDLIRIHELLIKHGYKNSSDDRSYSKHLAPYFKPGSVSIEVHFNITTPPFSDCFDVEEFWSRSQKYNLDGVEVLTLSPEDILLHMCIHTCVHHSFDNGLIPFLDIIGIIEHYDEKLNWDVFFNRSREWKTENCVSLMFSLTRKLFGLENIEQFIDEMKTDPPFLEALKVAEEMIFRRNDAGVVHVSPSVARLFDRNVSLQDKLVSIHSRVFPDKDALQISEQKKLEQNVMKKYSVYLRRFQMLFKDNSKVVWAALNKNQKTLLALETQNRRNHLKNWLTNIN